MLNALRWLIRLLLILLLVVLGSIGAALVSNQVPILAAPGPMERLPVYLTRNRIVTTADPALPELRLPYYEVAPEVAFEAATAAITDLGWELVRVDADQRSLHTVAVTRWLRFQNDFRVQIREAAPGLIGLHAVSQSRVGEADLGANLRHWLDFRHRFEQQLRRRPAFPEDEDNGGDGPA